MKLLSRTMKNFDFDLFTFKIMKNKTMFHVERRLTMTQNQLKKYSKF